MSRYLTTPLRDTQGTYRRHHTPPTVRTELRIMKDAASSLKRNLDASVIDAKNAWMSERAARQRGDGLEVELSRVRLALELAQAQAQAQAQAGGVESKLTTSTLLRSKETIIASTVEAEVVLTPQLAQPQDLAIKRQPLGSAVLSAKKGKKSLPPLVKMEKQDIAQVEHTRRRVTRSSTRTINNENKVQVLFDVPSHPPQSVVVKRARKVMHD